jgi:hypothetical protein
MGRAKLTAMQKAAKGRPCTLRIPNVHRLDPENSTSVLCHAPFTGRSGMRDKDWWAAIGCFKCHEYVDYRDKCGFNNQADWMQGIHETQQYFMDIGLLNVGKKA